MLDVKKSSQLFKNVLVNLKPKLKNSNDFPLGFRVNGVSYLLTINYQRTQPGYYNIYYLNVMEGYKKSDRDSVLNPLGFNESGIIFDEIKRKSKNHTKHAREFVNWYEPFKKVLKKLINHQLDPMWH